MKPDPTYYQMGDHTEAISIDFDPEVLSYEKLLEYFWNGHRCERVNLGSQYKNAVFFRDEAQKKIALKSAEKHAKRLGIGRERIKTDIVPLHSFTYAEGYHQKYALTRASDVRTFLESKYPSSKELADSSVAMRLNAYLGKGELKDWTKFLKELPSYGLPDNLEGQLRKLAEGQL